ncbi:MAG: hypothetical protein FJ368_02900 [Pelagibacterales bacterium]|nr:hypothetical protein [Pelagibacterales bacterium]
MEDKNKQEDKFSWWQKSRVFRGFGYGIVRMLLGHKIRKTLDDIGTPRYSDQDEVIEVRDAVDKNLVEVSFNGNCRPFQFVDIGNKCHVGVVYDEQTGKVDVIPKTLYYLEKNRHKMIDLKKTGGLFTPSDLQATVGKEAAKEVMQNLKDLRLVAHSNPKEFSHVSSWNQPQKNAAVMVNGRSSGRTLLAKMPRFLLNAMVFFDEPLLFAAFGPSKGYSRTDTLRKKLEDFQEREIKEKIVQETMQNTNKIVETNVLQESAAVNIEQKVLVPENFGAPLTAPVGINLQQQAQESVKTR